jgi:hypothetical protein
MGDPLVALPRTDPSLLGTPADDLDVGTTHLVPEPTEGAGGGGSCGER